MDEVTCSKCLMDLQENVFTREWVSYYFDLSAVKENAIISIEY
jgi:hypothetical protein